YTSKPQRGKSTTTSPGNRIAMVGQRTFQRYANDNSYEMFALKVEELEEEVDDEDKDEVLKTKVPSEYHDYLDLFKKKEGDKLPPHRPHVDHKIELVPGGQPTFGPLYNLSETEAKELSEYIKENLKKGFICHRSEEHTSELQSRENLVCR